LTDLSPPLRVIYASSKKAGWLSSVPAKCIADPAGAVGAMGENPQ
jgi:hypothetical protein